MWRTYTLSFPPKKRVNTAQYYMLFYSAIQDLNILFPRKTLSWLASRSGELQCNCRTVVPHGANGTFVPLRTFGLQVPPNGLASNFGFLCQGKEKVYCIHEYHTCNVHFTKVYLKLLLHVLDLLLSYIKLWIMVYWAIYHSKDNELCIFSYI